MFLPSFRMRMVLPLLAASSVLLAQEGDVAERLFRSGERAYAVRSFPEALESWGQVLTSAPKSPFAAEALLRMAKHKLEVDSKPEEALPLLDRLKTDYFKSPCVAEGLLLRGIILAGRSRNPGELKEAVGEFNRVVDLFPGQPVVQVARFHLGVAAKKQGQWGRALQHFTEVVRLDPSPSIAAQAQLLAAEVLDILGDLPGCLRLLQGVCTNYPQTPEAASASWRLAVRVKFRLKKGEFRNAGSWPGGKQKWLKTPILLATGSNGEIYLFQDDLDRAAVLEQGEAVPTGPVVKNPKVLFLGPNGKPWLIASRTGLISEDGAITALGTLTAPTGAFVNVWNEVWVSDARSAGLAVLVNREVVRTLPGPAVTAMAPLPDGGAVIASDANRSFMCLDASGQPRLTVPYGKDLPAPFKYVVALCSDPLGHVAAIVDGGDFEGIVLWGPDGSVLRQGTFKGLGLSGKFRAIALDREGGVLLADKSNDVMIRLD